MLAQLESKGISVERYNLAQQPLAFAQNTEVRAILEKEGTEALPLIYLDGALEIKGHYPDTSERSAIVQRLARSASPA